MIKLFVDSAVQRALAGSSLYDSRATIPEVFVDYLRRLNSGDLEDSVGVSDELFIAAAQILAELSLGANLVPNDFSKEAAIDALRITTFGDATGSVLDRLVAAAGY